MAELSQAQERLVRGLRRSERPLVAFGLALAVVGAVYASWGVLRFDPRADPRDDPGFDRPVARIAHLFHGYQHGLEGIVPATDTERVLRASMLKNLGFNAGVLAALVRLFIGTLAFVAGLAVVSVVAERHRLLRIIDRSRE